MSVAKDLISKTLPIQTTTFDTSIFKCTEQMKKYNISALPVLEGKSLLGIISERDLRDFVLSQQNAKTTTVSAFMTTNLITVDHNKDLSECWKLMEKHHIRHLLVLERKSLLGIISIRDVLSTLANNYKAQSTLLEDYIRRG